MGGHDSETEMNAKPHSDIIVTAPLPPFLYDPLKADYRCHDYVQATDKAAFLAGCGAVIRGLVQGGLTALWAAPAGFAVGTATYVLYHRLGRWTWADTFSTALVGLPLGLAYWLLPGPPSLLGISIAHIAATCGFLGPGPYLLKRVHLV